MKPRAYTQEEELQNFLQHVRGLARYWARDDLPGENRTVRGRLDGLAFSILSSIDGSSPNLPALKLVLDPHPEDKQYDISNGDKWHEPGLVVNENVALHELYYKEKT